MPNFLEHHQVLGTLIYDCETVPLTETFEELEEQNPALALSWFNEANKIREYRKSLSPEKYTDQELYEEYGGLYPEFGKVVAISAGIFSFDDEDTDQLNFYIKNLASEDEAKLLAMFDTLLNKIGNRKRGFVLGGYNIKVFDNPFLVKRYAINGLEIPEKLFSIGKKPWEINDIDIAELWKIGSYDKFVKLDVITSIFNVKSPKEDMDGSEVKKVFYSDDEGKLDHIAEYCGGDVLAVADIFLKLSGSTKEYKTIEF